MRLIWEDEGKRLVIMEFTANVAQYELLCCNVVTGRDDPDRLSG